MTLDITLWNTEWAKPKTKRGKLVSEALSKGDPDVVCVTEGYPEIIPGGHLICCHEDHGYQTTDGRRKVMLWSKQPWHEVDSLGVAKLPPGRFITGITETPLGVIRFIGVCIPWQDAHVRTGRKDREPWEDHLSYLDGLGEYLTQLIDMPTVLLGDFNQGIPRARQPLNVFEALLDVLRPTYRVVTDGVLPGVEQQSIDHVAIADGLEPVSIEAFSNRAEDGSKLSDHFGLRIVVQR